MKRGPACGNYPVSLDRCASAGPTVPCYSERMYQLLLFIRTAIGIFAAVLATALINQAALVPPVAAAWLVPLLAGFCGGLACSSLSPSQGVELAATSGAILALVILVPWPGGSHWEWHALLLLPGFVSGALGWVMLARWFQRRV